MQIKETIKLFGPTALLLGTSYLLGTIPEYNFARKCGTREVCEQRLDKYYQDIGVTPETAEVWKGFYRWARNLALEK